MGTMSIPEIHVQGWHSDGPVYKITRKLSGWRNRKARRAGELPSEQVGHPGGRNIEAADHFLVYTDGNDEAYAFNRGHVYEVEQIVDGDVQKILVDARENYAVHSFVGGIELLGARGLTDEELEGLLLPDGEVAEPEQPSNISDGAESQDVKGEPIWKSPTDVNDVVAMPWQEGIELRNEPVQVSEAFAEQYQLESGEWKLGDLLLALERGGAIEELESRLKEALLADRNADYDELTAPGEKGPEGLELYPDTTPADAELDAEDTAADEATEAARDAGSSELEQPAAESEPAPGDEEGSTGQVAEGSEASASPDDLTDEELEALTAPEAPADDEDAVGDDEDVADEEE